jgi:RimJ/RimL family protein N-acetyltransferase
MHKINLRALTKTDIEKTLFWHNQEDISDLYSGHPFPVNIEMEQKWYEKILTSNFPVTVFGIEFVENQSLIGLTVLKDINMINRSAEFAIYVGDKEYRGKGLSMEATLETLRFGFYKLGLYKSVGFLKEGFMRGSIFKNNQFRSELLLSILKEEFHG